MNSHTNVAAIEGRTEDRIRALWGCEGAIAKNALDANTDCQSLIKTLTTIRKFMQDARDDYAPDSPPYELCELIEQIEELVF